MTQETIQIIILIGLIIFTLLWLSYEYFEYKTKVPVFPSMPAVRKKIIELLTQEAANRTETPFTVLDLGSGSGQLSWHIAKSLPNAQITGVELSYIPWLRSVIRQRLAGFKNLNYIRTDFWAFDTSPFQAVITYLPGSIMERVGQKLRQELRPGTFIIANTFYLRADWVPIETLTVYVPFKTKLYIYRQQ